MSNRPLKLLHAADVLLDVPPRGIGLVPRDLVESIAGATLTAWERLADAAILHGVDAVLLNGNTFDANSESLAADVALRQGLDRLDEHEIPVFVVPGERDPVAAWQQIPSLPENVTLFDSAWDAPADLTDNKRLLARILPVSSRTDVAPPELERLQGDIRREAGLITIGMLWDAGLGEAATEPGEPTRRFASLSALVCRADTPDERLPLTEGHVHRQTSPQGMTADATGPRGATLLQFDGPQKISKRFLPLAPLRRERLTARLDSARHRDELCEQMLAALEEIPAIPGEQVRILSWSFAGGPESRRRLDWSAAAAAEVLETLTGLTDQPGGLRYVHEALPLWIDQSVPQELGELWRDYLEYFDERPAVTLDELKALATELRPQLAVPQGQWERWLQQLDPSVVQQRARRYARKWFAGT